MLEAALNKPEITTKNELMYESKKREEKRRQEGQILASSDASHFSGTARSGFGVSQTSGFGTIQTRVTSGKGQPSGGLKT